MKKEKLSKKKLKNLHNMLFVKRTYYQDTYHMYKEIKDYFYHTLKQVTLIRSLTYYYDCEIGSREGFVHWTCPELGGGNAGLKYWLHREKKQDKKEVYHEST